MSLKKPSLVLNVNDPEDAKLYKFVTQLPNGEKRNTSKFLRTLVDRAFQEEQKKKTETNVVRSQNGGIKFRVE